jgi:hypothetical protein
MDACACSDGRVCVEQSAACGGPTTFPPPEARRPRRSYRLRRSQVRLKAVSDRLRRRLRRADRGAPGARVCGRGGAPHEKMWTQMWGQRGSGNACVWWVRGWVGGSGCTKGLGTMMAHPGPHGPRPQSHPARCEIIAISPRSSRPDSPNLTPQTHFCGVRGGY